jgi:hypothetical protein
MHDPAVDSQSLEDMVGPAAAKALEATAGKLTKDVDILVFVAPGCGACPHQIRSVAALTMAGPTIAAEIVDATQEPELAGQYEVRSVPTTVVDDELIVVGVKHPVELAEMLLAREGPEGERTLFASMVEAERFADAADRFAYGPDPEGTARAFLELWARSTPQARMALMLVGEETLARSPEGLDPLVPLLVGVLADGDAGTRDEGWREDTADLLGRIGHPAARPGLEVLSTDPHPEVAEAAAEALESLRT